MRRVSSRLFLAPLGLLSAILATDAALARGGGTAVISAAPSSAVGVRAGRAIASRIAPTVGFSVGGRAGGPFGSGRVSAPPEIGFSVGGTAGGAYGYGGSRYPEYGGLGYGYGGFPYGYDGGDVRSVQVAPAPSWPTTIGIQAPPVQPPAIYVIGQSRSRARVRRERAAEAAPAAQTAVRVSTAAGPVSGPLIIQIR